MLNETHFNCRRRAGYSGAAARPICEDAGYRDRRGRRRRGGPGPVSEARHFDLVLLDIMLPKIDGFGVCELIRQQSQVPILMLTALDGEEQQLRGFGLDIDDYVTKPFSMPVLLEKIRVILRRAGECGGGQPPALPGSDAGPGRPGGAAGRPSPGTDRPGV